jgi:hypothetical protein
MSDYAMECDYYGTIEVEDNFDWGYEEEDCWEEIVEDILSLVMDELISSIIQKST